jgi:hypothetical protein
MHGRDELSMRDMTLCLMGHSAFQYLYAGLELGLFELLHRSPWSKREDVASALQLDDIPVRCLLMGVTALGFLRQSGEGYANDPLVDDLCQRGKLDLLLKISRFQAEIVYPGQIDFLESLRSNQNAGLQRFKGEGAHLYDRIAQTPALQKTFFEFMSAWSAESVPLLLSAVDFGDRRVVCDVGGGDATISIALAQAHPHLAIRLLDLPAGCALAQERIREQGLTDRIQTECRDVFASELPKGCDCVLFAHFLVIWSPEENIGLLKKAYEALPPGGQVVVFNSMSSDQGDGPLFAALDSAYFMAIPARGGLIYPFKDYESWLATAGFEDIRRVRDESWWTPHGVVTGRKK